MWQHLIDFLYPKKCVNCRKFGDYLCAACFAKINFNQNFSCPHCLRPTVNGFTHPVCRKRYDLEGVIPVVVYSGVVKKIIYQFKYKPYLTELKKPIGELMAEGLSQNESFYTFAERFSPVMVPIPLSKKRMRERGYNHAELITYYVAQYFKLSLNSSILIRVKDTKPQYKLNKESRVKNIKGAFGIKNGAKIPENIILIDDIATSYSTLKEATKILKRNGAKKVLGITFAKEA